MTNIWSLAVRAWRRLVPEPIRHEGATETSPTPKVELARADRLTAEPAPDWDTNVWSVDVHGALNALMDDFHADVEHIWGRFYEWLGIDGRTTVDLLVVGA